MGSWSQFIAWKPLRKEVIEAGNGQSVYNCFNHKQNEDPNPMFFSLVQIDQDNIMANLFWSDGKSKCSTTPCWTLQ